MSSAVAQKVQSQQVTLKGSAQLVSEFFNYGINSILYQRGIYPSESFTRKQEYGLTLLVSTDERVNKFLESVLTQIQEWLVERKIKKLVVVLTSVETKEVLERWEFKVEYETDEEAVAIANDTEYGLAAYVAGDNKEKLMYFARNLNAGQIHLNYASGGADAPFGGFKKSGNGREKAEWGLDEFLEIKAIMGT